MRLILLVLVAVFFQGPGPGSVVGATSCSELSCFFSKQNLHIVLPVIKGRAIDPFDAKSQWSRRSPKSALQKATLKIIESELRLHLGPYFKNEITFGQATKVPEMPTIRLLLVDNMQNGKGALRQKYKAQLDRLGKQGYGLLYQDSEIRIIAHSAVGLLNGSYGLLEKLGFRWFAPEKLWQVRPEKLQLTLSETAEFINPKMRLRGFWTWNGGNDRFLMWMARNRFNLMGDGPYNIDLAKALGIQIWGGGHNVISHLLDPKQDAGKGLAVGQVHPDWYGLPENASLEQVKKHYWKEDVYLNPCILDESLQDYFSQKLLTEISHGIYANIDILNLWLSDRKPLSFPKTCKNQQKYSNQTEAIFEFYNSVLERINKGLVTAGINRPFYIGGISYYTTWKLPQKVLPPATITANRLVARYLHFLYLNERSHTGRLFDINSTSSVNKKIAGRFKQWADVLRRQRTEFGTVEYYNYSIYLALPKTFGFAWQDMNDYSSTGSKIFGYMHVLDGNMGPKRLLHRILSRHSWMNEKADRQVRKDYFLKLYGKESGNIANSYEKLDGAMANISEVLGAVSSLNFYLNQHKYWKPPPMSRVEAKRAIEKILQGGDMEQAIIYKTWPSVPRIQTRIMGLSQSVAQLSMAEKNMQGVLKRSDGKVLVRLKSDLGWFSYAHMTYEALELLSRKMLAAGDLNRIKQITKRQGKIKEWLDTFSGMNATVSGIRQKRKMYGMIGLKK